VSLEITIVRAGNADLLTRVAAGVFDHAIKSDRCREFISDPRHHLAVAIESGVVVGMASAVHYVHPDKEPELWINEVAVAPTHQRRGLGKRLVDALLDLGRQLGCTEAWVLTDRGNAPAMRLYASCGGSEDAQDVIMFTFKLN